MREIICTDSLKWLKSQPVGSLPNVVTGICDQNEMGKITMKEYTVFFEKIASQIFEKLGDGCYAIFIQTDRKWDRRWLDKSYVLTSLARKYGYKTIWHKIVLHRPVGSIHLQRPTYAHMLCYSKEGTTGAGTPDVLPPGKKLYTNGTPLNAAEASIKFVKRYSKVKKVLDPFVGRGTIVAVAEKHGLPSIGIDISHEQCEHARKLNVK